MANILAISYYKPDTSYLTEITDVLRSNGDQISFIITSNGELKEQATRLLKDKNYTIIPIPQVQLSSSRNPFKRYKENQKVLNQVSITLLKDNKFDLVLTTSDLFDNTFFIQCKKQAIPTVYLQWTETHSLKTHEAWWQEEGKYFDSQNSSLYTLKRKLLRPMERLAGFKNKWPFNYPVDYLFVQGEFYKQMAIEGRVPANKIEVTGNPQCDEIKQAFSELGDNVVKGVKEQLNVGDSQKILLHTREHYARIKHLATEDIANGQKQIYEAMKQVCPDGKWVIKMHPKENEIEYAQVKELCPDATILENEIPTGNLIAACDVLLGTTSSTLVWGMGINKPTISAFLWKTATDFKLRRHWDGVEKVDSYNELVESISLNLNDIEHQKVWEKKRTDCIGDFIKLDGNCTLQIADRLSEIIKKKENV